MSAKERQGKDQRVKQGRKFEALAAKYYIDNGYKLLEKNWQAGHKEIDLIVQRDNLIIFVEVKSSNSQKFGHPSLRVDKKKINNLTKAAQQYLIVNDIKDTDLRFDLITFVKGQLEHFPDAFNASSD